jgi:general secretion pathway protein E
MKIFTKKKSIGQILVEKGKISESDLDLVLRTQQKKNEKIGKIFIDMGLITTHDFYRALAEQLDLPFLSLKDFPAEPPVIPRLTSKFLKENRIFPLKKLDGRIEFAVSDPYNLDALENISIALKKGYSTVITPEEDILTAIEQHYGAGVTSMEKIIESMSDEDLDIYGSEELEDIDHLRDIASEAPVIQLVNLFLSKAIEMNASDIHIEPGEKDLKIRYRIDGILQDFHTPPKRLQPAIISRIKIMSELNIAERRLPQDGRANFRVGVKEVDLRISTIPTIYGENVVMRILDRSSTMLSLEDLGFAKIHYEAFSKVIESPHGLLLVTGPTGSGKTTTLYAALNKINSREKMIITIEDPVEYELPGINQIQVKPQINLTFANGLRSIVRQDPDIVMVGEIRDLETAEIAVQSALTGHLVLSTVHTNDSTSTITRLSDMGLENYLVASCLVGILAQRLVRLICKNCKVEKTIDAASLHGLGLAHDETGTLTIFEGRGCEQCRETGYRGRTGIYEFLPMTNKIKDLVMDEVSATAIRQTAMKEGLKTLRDDGWDKVKRGLTTIEEVFRITQEESLNA